MDTRPGSAAYNPPPAFTNNTPTVDPGVRSQGDLINVSTVLLVPPVLKLWVDLATNTLQAWTLQADALGLLPADYNAVSNVKSWHQNPAVQFVAGGVTSPVAGQFFFSNSNGVSFGLSTGAGVGTLTASIASSLTAINVSAGSTSNNLSAITFSNSNGISFGLNGSVVTAAGYTASVFEPFPFFNAGNFSLTTGTLYVRPMLLPCAVSFTQINQLISLNMFGASSAVGTSGQMGFTNFFGIYSRSAVSGANSTNLVSAYTTSNTVSGAWSCSATSISMTYGWQTGTTNGSSSTSFSAQTTGLTNASFNAFGASQQGANTVLSMGEYWVAYLQSSSSAGGASASSILRVQMYGPALLPNNLTAGNVSFGHTGAYMNPLLGFGMWSTSTGSLPASVALSAIGSSSGGTLPGLSIPYFNFQA